LKRKSNQKGEKPKPRGSIGLSGYRVIDDPNDGVIKRLTALCEKMGMDVSTVPKPKQYPPLTLELHHDRRRCYFITAENETEFKAWSDVFKTCCRNAYGYRNQDWVHKKAFSEAIRRTRWELGRWGWYSSGGTEEQVLSDLISDQLDYAIMGRIYAKIQGAWQLRNLIRNKVLQVIDGLVMAAVTPAYKAMETVVNEIRPKIEPVIKELVDPIGTAEGELINKLKEGAMSIINPLLEQHVTPHLAKIVEAIQKPMVEGYEGSYKLWEEAITKYEVKAPKEDLPKSFGDLDRLQYSSEMWQLVHKTDVLYDPLWLLNVIFPDISPWTLIWRAHDEMKRTLDNAVYTFEQKLVKSADESDACLADGKATNDKIRAEVFEDYKFDAMLKTTMWYSGSIKEIIMPPFDAVVFPACRSLMNALTDSIPDAMKQFISPERLFEDLVNQIIDECIATVLKSGQ